MGSPVLREKVSCICTCVAMHVPVLGAHARLLSVVIAAVTLRGQVGTTLRGSVVLLPDGACHPLHTTLQEHVQNAIRQRIRSRCEQAYAAKPLLSQRPKAICIVFFVQLSTRRCSGAACSRCSGG